MDMKLRNAWVMALALCSAGAYAADEPGNWYTGLTATSFDFEHKGGSSYNTHGAIVRVGYDLGRYLSVEGRLGAGDNSSWDAANVRMEAQRVSGIYARAILPVDRVNLYVIGGYASVKAKAEEAGVGSVDKSLDSTSYGVGIELSVGRRAAVVAEYMRYLSEKSWEGEKFDVNALGFGLIYHF